MVCGFMNDEEAIIDELERQFPLLAAAAFRKAAKRRSQRGERG